MEFDEIYYGQFCSKGYDVLRPVRKALTHRVFLLPKSASVCVFAFGSAQDYLKWRKRFDNVYGYEINPTAVDHAERLGWGDYFVLQDVTVPFKPRWRTDVAVCSYLFEHITDQLCIQTMHNLVRCAPINFIVLTSSEDPAYPQDPTHSNSKRPTEWSRFVSSYYGRLGWKRWWADVHFCKFCYVHPEVAEALQASQRTFTSGITEALTKIRLVSLVRQPVLDNVSTLPECLET